MDSEDSLTSDRICHRETHWKVTIHVECVAEPCPPLLQRTRGASDLAEAARALIPADEREHFIVFLLDGRNRIKGYAEVSIGTLNAAIVHPRDVFRPAIVFGAASIVIAHNHPSGEPQPSAEDFAVTRRLREVGELVGVPVLDHVVVGDGRHFSFLESGALTSISGTGGSHATP